MSRLEGVVSVIHALLADCTIAHRFKSRVRYIGSTDPRSGYWLTRLA